MRTVQNGTPSSLYLAPVPLARNPTSLCNCVHLTTGIDSESPPNSAAEMPQSAIGTEWPARLPAPPEFVQIGQPDAAVHEAALDELFPQVLFPLLCLPLVEAFGVRHLMPDDTGQHQ